MAEASVKKRRRGWRKPAWKDPAFWFAVGLTVVLVALQVWFIADRTNWWSWAGLALQAAVTWVLISALIRIRVGMQRALVEGHREAEEAARAKASGMSMGEAAARSSGRAVGRAYGAYKRSRDD